MEKYSWTVDTIDNLDLEFALDLHVTDLKWKEDRQNKSTSKSSSATGKKSKFKKDWKSEPVVSIENVL